MLETLSGSGTSVGKGGWTVVVTVRQKMILRNNILLETDYYYKLAMVILYNVTCLPSPAEKIHSPACCNVNDGSLHFSRSNKHGFEYVSPSDPQMGSY